MPLDLLPCECVRGMTQQYQLAYIYEAMRRLAGSPADLPDAQCVLASPFQTQLAFVYCAILSWANGGGPTPVVPELLGILNIDDPSQIDSFGRAVAAAYTGNGDSVLNQREAAVDVLRQDDYPNSTNGPSMLIQDEPTSCVLVAPGNIAGIDNGDGTFNASWDAIPVTVSLLRYEYRLDGTGSWTSNGTGRTLTSVAASLGSHVLDVRAVSTSGVLGTTGVSPSFSVTNASAIALVAHAAAQNPPITAARNTTGANFLVVVAGDFSGGALSSISDTYANTWHALTSYSGAQPSRVTIFYAYNATVGPGHVITSTGGGGGAVAFAAFSGVKTAGDPFDVENGTFSVGSFSSLQPGSVTPSQNNELFITGSCLNNEASLPSPYTLSINQGFIITDQLNGNNASYFGIALAYFVQGAAAALNPTWSNTTTSDQWALDIATFKAP